MITHIVMKFSGYTCIGTRIMPLNSPGGSTLHPVHKVCCGCYCGLSVYSQVADGAVLTFGRIRLTARHTPAHTSGHVVYILDGTPFHSQNALFSGDLLFIGGAGDIWLLSVIYILQLIYEPLIKTN